MVLGLVFNWVIKSSLMASILAVLILLINYALRNKLAAKWQYAIWMLLIIRLLIPCEIQSPWSIYSLLPNNSVPSLMVNQANIWRTDNDTKIDISGKEIQLTNDQSILNKQSNTKSEEPIAEDLSNIYIYILAILWLVGVLILAILTIATNLRFYFKVRREPSATDARMSNLIQECSRKLGIRKNLPIIITNRIEAPCLYGILSPKLLLPESLVNRLTEENIRHIFIHELTHYKRNDILINWLAVAAQIIHWFNPLIWYSFAKMREDCELACDADSLSFLEPEEYQSYGLSIISLVTPAQSSWLSGTTGFFGNKNNQQIKRRIKMIKFFQKTTLKWTWTAIVIVMCLGLVGFTNSISKATPAEGVNPPKQPVQSNRLSPVTDGSLDYNKSLSFTPLLPSYTAGYQLTDSSAYKEISPPSNNVSRYLARYGSSEKFKFMVHETTNPEGMYPLYFAEFGQAPKTQIQIGDVPATLYESKYASAIQFIKDDIEYTVGARYDGGISLDDLKKICESIVVSVNSPPTNFYINKTGPTASERLSFKTLQPGDITIPQGYKFQVASSKIYIEGNKKSEVFGLLYTADASDLDVEIGKGDHPFGEPTPVLTPDADFDTKQIDGTKVKLRRKNNVAGLPVAKFTIPENGLECIVYSTVQESEVEKVVESILQAYSKL
ncbi:M56 family metallopeptidase [Desulfosporosinus sp. OT]|uniref:M56 family metallopeptidase n=1 Tax=Desulfosporosinus sp. OT TaxID=913865 RepID=UPI000223A997|nr:M56 family metallopeptidase [Desulfosporosinus sp. OT]EGW37006.1 blaR1 peptidase M56 family protein [Desulfosporosinus sp. OT]